MASAADVKRMQRTIDLLRSWGVIVYEQSGWQSTNSSYPVVPNHSLDHHDASSVASGEWGAHGYCLSKRICALFVPRCLDGVQKVSVISCGTAPHAGVGSWTDIPTNDGNRYMHGIEKGNAGGTERYTSAAYTTQVKIHRALWQASMEQGHKGAPRDFALGHKEYGNRYPGGSPGRKTDPNYDMNQMRNDVQNFNSAAPNNEEGEEDMGKILRAEGRADAYQDGPLFIGVNVEESRNLQNAGAKLVWITGGTWDALAKGSAPGQSDRATEV